jgi:cyclopropane fatty-acyl-phospholipid synthase-like methyltransferase
MAHSFADVERYAASFDNPERDAWQMPDRVIAALGLQAGQSVADIGAGTGYFTIRLAKSVTSPKVFAVDVEEGMVEHIRQRALDEGLRNVFPTKTTADRANLPERVDVVLIVDTYHHIGNRPVYFSKLRSLIKPLGRLAIIDFRKDAPEGPPVQFRFTTEEITAELAQAGFTLQAQHAFLPRQLFLVYGVN